MPAPRKYPDELGDRAVRLVREDGEHGAIARVADRLDINRETLRNWVKADRRRTVQPQVVDLEAENARLRRDNAELVRANEISKLGEELSLTTVDGARCHPIDASCACSPIASHPTPRHHKEGRISDEVEQVIEPTVSAVGRPSGQLDLDAQYP